MPFRSYLTDEPSTGWAMGDPSPNFGVPQPLSYSRATMRPAEVLKFGGAVALFLVGLYLMVISGGGVCPEREFYEYDMPCPTILSWATFLLWAGVAGGLYGTCYYVVKAIGWQYDVREASRSRRAPRIILSREGSDFGLYRHHSSSGEYIGTWRVLLSWINNTTHSTFRCVSCRREFVAALNLEDNCWYWIQPHEGCELFLHENWELYLDNSSSSRRQGWDVSYSGW